MFGDQTTQQRYLNTRISRRDPSLYSTRNVQSSQNFVRDYNNRSNYASRSLREGYNSGVGYRTSFGLSGCNSDTEIANGPTNNLVESDSSSKLSVNANNRWRFGGRRSLSSYSSGDEDNYSSSNFPIHYDNSKDVLFDYFTYQQMSNSKQNLSQTMPATAQTSIPNNPPSNLYYFEPPPTNYPSDNNLITQQLQQSISNQQSHYNKQQQQQLYSTSSGPSAATLTSAQSTSSLHHQLSSYSLAAAAAAAAASSMNFNNNNSMSSVPAVSYNTSSIQAIPSTKDGGPFLKPITNQQIQQHQQQSLGGYFIPPTSAAFQRAKGNFNSNSININNNTLATNNTMTNNISIRDWEIAQLTAKIDVNDFRHIGTEHTDGLLGVLSRRTPSQAGSHRPPAYSGTLLVHLMAGVGLSSLHSVIRDLYCVLETDSVRKSRSMIRTATHAFDWDELFQLELLHNTCLSFLCYQWDPRLRHRLCFYGNVTLEPLLARWQMNHVNSEKLVLQLEPKGLLYFQLQYFTLGETFIRRPNLLHHQQTTTLSDNSVVSSVFGVALKQLILLENNATMIPLVIRHCVEEVDFRGLEVVGIYRLTGSIKLKIQLKSMFDRAILGTTSDDPSSMVNITSEAVPDIHAITSVLKDFLRELPEPLFTDAFYQMIVNAYQIYKNSGNVSSNSSNNANSSQKLLLNIVDCLPAENQNLIFYLMDHLLRVVNKSQINKSDSWSLSQVFGPLLFYPSPKLTNKQPQQHPQQHPQQQQSIILDPALQAEMFQFLLDLWPSSSTTGGSNSIARYRTKSVAGSSQRNSSNTRNRQSRRQQEQLEMEMRSHNSHYSKHRSKSRDRHKLSGGPVSSGTNPLSSRGTSGGGTIDNRHSVDNPQGHSQQQQQQQQHSSMMVHSPPGYGTAQKMASSIIRSSQQPRNTSRTRDIHSGGGGSGSAHEVVVSTDFYQQHPHTRRSNSRPRQRSQSRGRQQSTRDHQSSATTAGADSSMTHHQPSHLNYRSIDGAMTHSRHHQPPPHHNSGSSNLPPPLQSSNHPPTVTMPYS